LYVINSPIPGRGSPHLFASVPDLFWLLPYQSPIKCVAEQSGHSVRLITYLTQCSSFKCIKPYICRSLSLHEMVLRHREDLRFASFTVVIQRDRSVTVRNKFSSRKLLDLRSQSSFFPWLHSPD